MIPNDQKRKLRKRLMEVVRELGLPVPTDHATTSAINAALASEHPEKCLRDWYAKHHRGIAADPPEVEGGGEEADGQAEAETASGEPSAEEETTEPTPGEEPSIDVGSRGGRVAELRVPLIPKQATEPGRYRPSLVRIELMLSDPAHKQFFEELYYGLIDSNAKLASGRPVSTSADVLRWLAEQGLQSASKA